MTERDEPSVEVGDLVLAKQVIKRGDTSAGFLEVEFKMKRDYRYICVLLGGMNIQEQTMKDAHDKANKILNALGWFMLDDLEEILGKKAVDKITAVHNKRCAADRAALAAADGGEG